MLEPQTRKLLFDVLQPPEDHTLDFAIGTTFTLDLLALLIAPVAFTLFEADDPAKLLHRDSLALLESLRRYSDRMAIFCHSGHIAVPNAQFPQFEYLEKMVVQCKPPIKGAIFHPKIWLLRFSGPEDLVTYRFACLTRNLTFDRCWDTVVTLEGPLLDRQRAVAANHPLGDFVAALPSFTDRISPVTVDRIAQMQSEVRRVDFHPPEDVEEFSFHPLGIEAKRHQVPFEGVGNRMLIVSPFATDNGLRRLVRGRQDCILVSRADTLQQLAEELPEINQVFALDEQADTPAALEEDIPLSRGLHAKCYVIDDGWKASIWTGSANATEQAFNGNIEFLVKLVGSKSKFGIDALLRTETGKTGFRDLLVPFSKAEGVTPEPLDDEIEAAINAARQILSNAAFHAEITSTTETGLFNLTLKRTQELELALPETVTVSCWPVTLGQAWKRSVSSDLPAIVFEGISLEALTSFFAFEVIVSQSTGKQRSESFVFNVVLQGVPSDRRERLLRSMIGDRQRFLQLVICMLADEGFDLSQTLHGLDRISSSGESRESFSTGISLFESLVRNLERSPERLDHIASLIDELRRQPETDSLLPVGFDLIWKPIWAARQKGQ